MGWPTGGRVRRVEPAREIDARDGRAPGYASAFAADVVAADARSAEQWARAVLEGAPLLLRLFVLFGWKRVLGLRLAPRGTARTVAGWTQLEVAPASTTLEAASRWVTARKVLTVEAHRLTLATYVWYEGRLGRIVWSAIAPVHHRIEPVLITSAASRHRRAAADGAR